jgi:hypothetical protein
LNKRIALHGRDCSASAGMIDLAEGDRPADRSMRAVTAREDMPLGWYQLSRLLPRDVFKSRKACKMLEDDFQYEVFLSHSAKDNSVVRDVTERLRKDGVKGGSMNGSSSRVTASPRRSKKGWSGRACWCSACRPNAFGSEWAQLKSGTLRFSRPTGQGTPLPSPWRPTPHQGLRNTANPLAHEAET